MRKAIPVVALLLGLALTAARAAPDGDRNLADRVFRLIAQLGSPRFADRDLVPFWEALDLLCREAGLSERGAFLQGAQEVRISTDPNGRLVRQYVQRSGYAGLGDGSLHLLDVRPTARPTSVAGAVRFHA